MFEGASSQGDRTAQGELYHVMNQNKKKYRVERDTKAKRKVIFAFFNDFFFFAAFR